jgi:hypothetical protein
VCRDLELAANLADVPVDGPTIGSRVAVKAQQARSYGIACDIEGSDHLVGLLTEAHLPAASVPEPGDRLDAIVLDMQPVDGIVDLSAKKVRTLKTSRWIVADPLQVLTCCEGPLCAASCSNPSAVRPHRIARCRAVFVRPLGLRPSEWLSGAHAGPAESVCKARQC